MSSTSGAAASSIGTSAKQPSGSGGSGSPSGRPESTKPRNSCSMPRISRAFAISSTPICGSPSPPPPPARAPDRRQPLPHLRPVHGRVEHRATLAAGAGGHQDARAFGDVAGHGRGPLARLVVGMGVHGEQSQLVGLLVGQGHPGIVPRSGDRTPDAGQPWSGNPLFG